MTRARSSTTPTSGNDGEAHGGHRARLPVHPDLDGAGASGEVVERIERAGDHARLIDGARGSEVTAGAFDPSVELLFGRQELREGGPDLPGDDEHLPVVPCQRDRALGPEAPGEGLEEPPRRLLDGLTESADGPAPEDARVERGLGGVEIVDLDRRRRQSRDALGDARETADDGAAADLPLALDHGQAVGAEAQPRLAAGARAGGPETDGDPDPVVRRQRSPPFERFPLGPPQALVEAERSDLLPQVGPVALAPEVPEPELERVDAEATRDRVGVRLLDEDALRGQRGPVRSERWLVGADAVAFHLDGVEPVRPEEEPDHEPGRRSRARGGRRPSRGGAGPGARSSARLGPTSRCGRPSGAWSARGGTPPGG